TNNPVHDLALGIDQFKDNGMVIRQQIALVFEYEGQVKRVAWPPHTSLAKEESLQTFLNDLARNIEIAHQERCTVHQSQIASLRTVAGDDSKRNGTGVDGYLAIGIGFCRCDLL